MLSNGASANLVKDRTPLIQGTRQRARGIRTVHAGEACEHCFVLFHLPDVPTKSQTQRTRVTYIYWRESIESLYENMKPTDARTDMGKAEQLGSRYLNHI